jgi:hypothetical protein
MSSLPCPLLCLRHCETQKSEIFIAAIGAPVHFCIEQIPEMAIFFFGFIQT